MKSWEKRFFELNRNREVELKGHPFHHVLAVLRQLDWKHQDSLWAPDLEVSQFLKPGGELFLLNETYFDPKLTGTDEAVAQVQSELESYEPPTVFYAGGS